MGLDIPNRSLISQILVRTIRPNPVLAPFLSKQKHKAKPADFPTRLNLTLKQSAGTQYKILNINKYRWGNID